MKKILFGFILMAISAVINAQTYYPFPTDTAQWSVVKIATHTNTLHQNLRGDTIINGKTYNKIYQSYSEDYFTPNQYLKCFIREDTTRKVYIKYPNNSTDFPDTSEFLLYDFGLAVGDAFSTTLKTLGGGIQQGVFILDSIGLISTNTGYRKKYNFTFISYGDNFPVGCLFYPFYWIEGIGSPNGPFFNEIFENCQGFGVFIFYSLECYQEDFNYIIGGSMCHFDGIRETEQFEYFIQAYPNPAKGNISFTYKLPENNKNASIIIYNLMGALIAEYPISPNSKTLNINIGKLNCGIYFYSLNMEEHECIKNKLIIIK